MSPLRQAILNTLAYFDLFDYPLTAMEVWRYLYAPGMESIDFEKIFAELSSLLEEKKIETKNGFYFLCGRTEIVQIRAERYALSFYKYRRARFIAKLLSFIPGVKMIALGNTAAWRHSRKESDIDFFIITASGRIWTTRMLSVFPISALGLRPQKTSSANAVCLSFYASEDALNLRQLMVEEDIYFPYWTVSIVPLCAASGIYEKFKEQNAWVRQYLPNVSFREPAKGIKKASLVSGLIIPQIFEDMAKRIQAKLFPPQIKRLSSGGGTAVIASDQYLKFHTDDRRAEIRDKWKEKINAF
ncbi:hypothetical protein HYT45_00375 [Candidatus Uhrbacteria bacterium]|nr:hypothetical protein [Candidatus Uhrbacteria bacterium]